MSTFTRTEDDLNLDFSDRHWEASNRRGSKIVLEFKLQPDTDGSEDDESESEECDLEDEDEYYFDHRLEFCDYVQKSKVSVTNAIEICTECASDVDAIGKQKTSGAIVQNGHVDGLKESDEEHKLSTVIDESCSISARRNDREEIRKKLAMGEEDDCCDDDDEGENSGYKKPTIQSRLHSGLQICFMNESPGSTDSEGLSPRQHDIHDNLKLMSNTRSLVDSDNNLSTMIDLNTTTATNKADLNTIANSTFTQIENTSPPRLKIQIDEASTSEEDFQSKQEKLQNEAKMALAQAGTMAHMQLEIERQVKKKSPMAEMVGILDLGEQQKKLSLRQLQQMNLAQIQVLYNDLQTQIENLNEELVHLLMERDEQHMEQDSMLVDIEDLTRRAEELAAKTNRESRSKSTMKGKLPNR